MSFRRAIEAAAVLAGQRDERELGSARRDETSVLSKRLAARLRAFAVQANRSTAADDDDEQDVTTLQDRTGEAGLQALLDIQRTAIEEKQRRALLSSSTTLGAPIFGSRDLQTLRIVLGIVANWGLTPLIAAYDASLASHRPHSRTAPPKLQELDEEEATAKKGRDLFIGSRSALAAALSTVDQLLPYDSPPTEKHERPLAHIVLDVCSLHILAGHIRLGWGPENQQARECDDVRQHSTQVVSRILKGAPTHSSLNALSGIAHIGPRTTQPVFVKATTEMLFAAQLLRPDGVMALLRNSFGQQDDGNERGLMKKLVSVGQVLSTPPVRMSADVFASVIAPRLLEVMAKMPGKAKDDAQQHSPSELATPAQKNAACFAMARLAEVAPEAVKEVLQEQVYRYICPAETDEAHDGETAVTHTQLSSALELLFEVVSQSEPSSQFVTSLLAPICVALFIIHATDTDSKNAARPIIAPVDSKGKSVDREQADVKEVAGTLFKTWLRLADAADAAAPLLPNSRDGVFALSSLQPGALRVGLTEHALIPVLSFTSESSVFVEWQRQRHQEETLAGLDSMTLDDFGGVRLSEQDGKSDDFESELTAKLLSALDLRPSPRVLTELLKLTKRRDVAANLLVALLDAYALARQTRASGQAAEGNDVLYVQHILRLIDGFGVDVLQGQLDKVLRFVDFALSASRNASRTTERTLVDDDDVMPFIKPQKDRSALIDLREVSRGLDEDSTERKESAHDHESEETDGDDDDELVETALNLLLALLEGDPTVTAETNSLLKVITSKVKALINSENNTVRPLAKEANLVLSARQSATSLGVSAGGESLGDATPRERALAKGKAMYQEALVLLQDPILPVRAHGLIVLRELVAFGTTDDSRGTLMEPALTVAVLDIFVQAVCDDESYLYLNAVQGLAAMGTTGGHAMVRRLMRIYVGEHAPKTQAEVDKRLRVGEAMLQVVQKLADALAKYIDDIVGPLLMAVRDATLSTTLRTSMLSIVGTCIEACPQAMISKGYARHVAEAMLDLLRVEVDTRRAAQGNAAADDALTRDTKLPMLRRAALLLLSLLIRGATMQLEAGMEKRDEAAAAWNDETPRITTLRMPGGAALSSINSQAERRSRQDSAALLFAPDLMPRLRTVVGYVAQMDNDALTRHQASEVQNDVEMLQLFIVQTGAADVATQ